MSGRDPDVALAFILAVILIYSSCHEVRGVLRPLGTIENIFFGLALKIVIIKYPLFHLKIPCHIVDMTPNNLKVARSSDKSGKL